MILVTVGTQLPFDRLIAAMDELAPSLAQPVFAQVGQSTFVPRNMEWVRELDPVAFGARVQAASILVAHAGTGTVLAAQRHGKPLILFPRRAALNEHRNDHQLATVEQLRGKRGLYIAQTTQELQSILTQPLLPAGSDDDEAGRALFVQGLRKALKNWS